MERDSYALRKRANLAWWLSWLLDLTVATVISAFVAILAVVGAWVGVVLAAVAFLHFLRS